MSVKRIKKTDGVFTHTHLEVDLTRPEAGDRAAIDTIFRAAAPASRIQALKFFADTLEADNKSAARVSIRLKALRAAITEAETAQGRERLALIGKADLMRREIEALPYTLRGLRFTGNKRGLSRLYREAVTILENSGSDYPAKCVRSDLEKNGVTRDELETLHWIDDTGTPKTTTIKQFETSLSRHRARIR